ncbi:MAG: Gfo/Idh/MocA family oxidoreductase [Oscillospiraceae bacterium]
MKEYGVLIVGTGWVSGEHIRAFSMNPHAKVVALVSRDAEKGHAKAVECGVPEAKVYTDYAQALCDPAVDIVSICTPNHLHASQTILAAEAGKHILIEKPISLNWEDAKAMKAAVDKAGVKTLVGYVLHWNSLFLTAKKMQEEYIGKLYYAETDYFHRVTESYPCYRWTCQKDVAGSSLLAGGCHAVDAMRFFMQDEVEEVVAYSSGCRTDFEYDGTLVALLKFKGGAMGKIGSSYDTISPYIFNLHLFGDKGSLLNNKLYSPDAIPGQRDYMVLPVETPNSGDVTHHPFPQEIDHFLDCIVNDRETSVSLNDAMKTQEIVFAADLSAATGKPVKLPLQYD